MQRGCWLVGLLLISCLGCGRRPGPPVAKVAEITPSGGAIATGEKFAWAESDWPMWRGQKADGISTGLAVPTTWTETENVLWKTKFTGRGHSCPIIVGDFVYLATADEGRQVQSVLCFNRKDGQQAWETKLHEGHFETAMHNENTQATSTLACDGEKLFALFLNDRKIWATALDLKGKQVWQKEVGTFASKFGYSASPTLYESLVIIAADHQQGGYLAALNRADGNIVWRKLREAKSSYASPRVIELGGKPQLVVAGCNLISSYDPLTGEALWSTPGTAEAAVGTVVVDQDLVFASGGYPEQDTVALKGDGTVAWREGIKVYCPSMLTYQGHLYLVDDNGIARCFEAQTGKKKWEKRIGGNFRASLILSGENIIITDMSGKTTIFKASPASFELVAENQLGNEGFASPGISNGQLFLRVVDQSKGPRQEWLYCIGKK